MSVDSEGLVAQAAVGFLGDSPHEGDDPAGQLLLGEVAIEPAATGAGFINKGQIRGLGGELLQEFIDVALAGADGTERDDLPPLGTRECRTLTR